MARTMRELDALLAVPGEARVIGAVKTMRAVADDATAVEETETLQDGTGGRRSRRSRRRTSAAACVAGDKCDGVQGEGGGVPGEQRGRRSRR